MRVRIPALTLPVALASACADFPTCDDAAAFPPSVVFGVGETELTPVVDGAMLPITWGMQGGQHVWVGLRATGIVHRAKSYDDNPHVSFALDMNGAMIGSGASFDALFGATDDARLVGAQLYLDYVDPASIPEDAIYTASVSVTDVCGTTLQDSHNVTMGW